MKCVDAILGDNIEYKGSMLRLPILVLIMLKRKQTGEGGTLKRLDIWLFEGVKVD